MILSRPEEVKEVFPTVWPSCLTVINSSLSSGVVPVNFKHAVVQPLLKKTWAGSYCFGRLSLNCLSSLKS